MDDLSDRIGQLKSFERNVVAKALCNLYIDTIKKDCAFKEIPDYLDEYIKLVFQAPEIKTGDEFNAQLTYANRRQNSGKEIETLAERHFKEVSKNPDMRKSYIAHLARMAQLLELSGHLARENFFDSRAQEKIPGGVGQILYEIVNQAGQESYFLNPERNYIFSAPEEAVHYLNAPVFEISLTQHPTNILTLETASLIRQLHDAAREVCATKGDSLGLLNEKIYDFSMTELTPLTQDEPPKIRNFTADEELAFTINTIRQLDKNLNAVYKTYDDALTKKFEPPSLTPYTEEMRWQLFLDLRLKSWTMGDKDGNQNVKAEHLLLATLKHRRLGVELAISHLNEMRVLGVPNCDEWLNDLERAQAKLAELNADLEDILKKGDNISQNRFDEFNQSLAQALKDKSGETVGWSDFENRYLNYLRCTGTLSDKESKKNPVNDNLARNRAEALLTAYRSMKTFGLRGARIELRDTAKAYGDIVDYVFTKGDKSLSNELKAQNLDYYILNEPDEFKKMADAFLAKCDEEMKKDPQAFRTYDKSDPKVLAYHTLKRLQVAALNPDLFQDSILAECDHELRLIQNVALQKMVRGANDGELHLHIVPLFEKIPYLKNAPDILKKAFRLRSYRDHCLALAGGDFSQLRQEVQIAHSDNIRRGGTPAGRSAISEVHDALRSAMDDFQTELKGLYANEDGHAIGLFSLKMIFFEGMSLSHVLRGGGKSLTDICNTFSIHDYTHITAQGADLHGYFDLPTSSHRLLTRFFVHSSKELAYTQNTPKPPPRSKVEDKVSAACAECEKDYIRDHFGNDKTDGAKTAVENTERFEGNMGYLLAHHIVNHRLYSQTGNRGLRSTSRNESIPEDYVSPENNTRAIGIAENMFDADLLPTWLGCQNLLEHLSRQLLAPDIYDEFSKQATKALSSSTAWPKKKDPAILSPKELKGLYQSSPQFRDIINQMALGLVASDLNRLQRRLIKANRNVPISDKLRVYVYDTLPKDYIAASKLVLGSFGITYDEKYDPLFHDDSQQIAYMRHMIMAEAIPNYAKEFDIKSRFVTALVVARDEMLSQEGFAKTDADMIDLCNLLAGRMIISNGRMLFGYEDKEFTRDLENDKRRNENIRRLRDAFKKEMECVFQPAACAYNVVRSRISAFLKLLPFDRSRAAEIQ